MRREIICIIGVIIGLLFVIIGKSYGMDYVGVSAFYGHDTFLIDNHVDSGDSEKSYGMDLTLGWIHERRWHYGIEFDINKRELDGGEVLTTAGKLFGSYDFIHSRNFQMFVGAGAGLGVPLQEEDYYLLHEDKQEQGGMIGVLDARLGCRFRIGPSDLIKIQYKENHISKPFVNDNGSNTSEIYFGFIHEF